MSNEVPDQSQNAGEYNDSEETRPIYRALSEGELIRRDDEVLAGVMWTMDYYASTEHASRVGTPYDPSIDLPHRRRCQPPVLTKIARSSVVKL